MNLSLLYCVLLVGCASSNPPAKIKSIHDLNRRELAAKLYEVSDLHSIEGAFNYGATSRVKLYREPEVAKIYQNFYDKNKFKQWLIAFLNNNFSSEDLIFLIEEYQSLEFTKIKNLIQNNQYQESKYKKFVNEMKNSENNIERAEVVARIIIITKLVDITHSILSELAVATKRTNYFIKYDYAPNTKMLLKLKELEMTAAQNLAGHHQKVFEEMALTLLYSFKDLSNSQLYNMHNFFNQDKIRNLNERVSVAIADHLRNIRLEYTKELMVYMSEKYSDRMPAVESK